MTEILQIIVGPDLTGKRQQKKKRFDVELASDARQGKQIQI